MGFLGCEVAYTALDWSACFRERALNTAIPYLGLLLSVAIFAVQYALSKRKHKHSAIAVAQLDPSASNIVERNGNSEPKRRRQGVFGRLLSTLLPWNASRLLGYQRLSTNDAKTKSEQEVISPATLAVFQSENAMILNEVHSIPLTYHSDEEARSSQILNVTQRLIHTIASVSLAGLHASGFAMGGGMGEAAWAVFWSYFAVLGAFSFATSHSLYTHKAVAFLVYMVIAGVNLRSAVLREAHQQVIIMCSAKLAVDLVALIPTIFFPLESKIPAHLLAIHQTMQARTQFGALRTAIPTPMHGSPRNGSVHLDSESNAATALNGNHSNLRNAVAAFGQSGSDEKDDSPPPPPEVTASLYSRLYFSFATSAIVKHYKEQFTLPAVPDLPPGDKAAAVVAAFRADSSKDSQARRKAAAGPFAEHESADEEGDADEPDSSSDALIPSSRPLALRLFKHFAPYLVLQFIWAALEAFLELTPAIGLRWVLSYISERDAERNGGQAVQTPFHMAVGYVLFMTLGQCFSALAASQALFIGRRICIRLRAILITEIISKTLRRSDIGGATKNDADDTASIKSTDTDADDDEVAEGARATDGQVTNLVSVDVFKVSEICAYLHFVLPQAPVTILFCLYLLYDLLGWSALVGFGTLALALPMQIFVAKFFVKLQKRLLEATDRRLNLTTEVLNCIKTVKFFAWEEAFAARLGETRSRELHVLAQRCFAWLASAFFFIGTPVLVTAVTFGVHTQVFHQPLNAETAFTALALFNLLRLPMDALPDMIVQILSSLVSVRRIDRFLREAETEKYEQLLYNNEGRGENDPVVGFQDATFAFQTREQDEAASGFSLQSLNLSFPEGQLSIIAGPVGSGKTCLLLSLLGETKRIGGRTFMPCPVARALEPIDPLTGLSETVAYVSQSAWLLGTTVRENILFGSPYNEKRYKAVLKACSLQPDLKILEYHDETEVGEKGTSLSGGQKARVALARALYSPAKYILIDDALSAVDAHTAEHLYTNYLKGPLMTGRTCLLVTHSVPLVLPGAAYAVYLDEGKVVAAGPASELLAQGVFDHETGTRSNERDSQEAGKAKEREEPIIEEIDEEARANEEAEIKTKQDRKKLTSLEETYGSGAVGLKHYKLYMKSFFKRTAYVAIFWIGTMSVFSLSRLLDVGTSAWLRKWASSYSGPVEERHQPAAAFVMQSMRLDTKDTAEPLVEDRTMYYLKIYTVWVFAYILISLARDGIMLWGALRASRNLYERMTNAILNARPQFFDRTPIGRIMNRFSKDLEAIDQDISPSFMFLLDVILEAVVILAVSSWALPWFLFFSMFVVAVYATIGVLYIVSSRDLKRIESVQRSPVFTLVGEVLGGSVAIRAYGDSARFTRHCLRLIDKASRPFFFLWYENRWLSMRVDTFAGLVSLVVGLGLILKKDVDAALAGFTLSFTVQLVDAALWIVRMVTENEINFNSVERIGEYLDIEPEKSIGVEPPAHWPTASGKIVVKDLTVRYSPEFEPVLKGVSFEVQPGEKVGIVGRTGSGKSTLALSMFRFLEAEAGSITIDGISIGGIPLKTLRRRLTVIPQDAQLFSGTVRSNLDPFSQYDDTELWMALQRCKLASSATPGASLAPTRPGSPSPTEGPSVFTTLESPIEQGGRNLSAGQRQLLALARGLLKMRDSRILILDESTANLDAASDQQIQRTIRSEMSPSSTILVIAHRLRTIIDFDKILVLDKGNVLEFDSPMNLLNKSDSSFRELCERSGEFDLLRDMAEEAAQKRSE
ncbi:unnamed protein product [Sympodiomycopsis kandeliae]